MGHCWEALIPVEFPAQTDGGQSLLSDEVDEQDGL